MLVELEALAELVSIGTLFAFFAVSAGLIWRRCTGDAPSRPAAAGHLPDLARGLSPDQAPGLSPDQARGHFSRLPGRAPEEEMGGVPDQARGQSPDLALEHLPDRAADTARRLGCIVLLSLGALQTSFSWNPSDANSKLNLTSPTLLSEWFCV